MGAGDALEGRWRALRSVDTLISRLVHFSRVSFATSALQLLHPLLHVPSQSLSIAGIVELDQYGHRPAQFPDIPLPVETAPRFAVATEGDLARRREREDLGNVAS